MARLDEKYIMLKNALRNHKERYLSSMKLNNLFKLALAFLYFRISQFVSTTEEFLVVEFRGSILNSRRVLLIIVVSLVFVCYEYVSSLI